MDYDALLLPLALLLVASKVLMKLCQRLRLPGVIGMLLAGILVGLIQYIPNQNILTEDSLTGLGFFSKIGVILIMFSAGLETDLHQIRRIGGPAVLITVSGVVVPLALGFLVATVFHGGFGNLDRQTALQNVFYGVILTATSVSVSVATLREAGKLNTRAGTTIVTAAILDDILGIVVLSFVLGMQSGAETGSGWMVLVKTLAYFVVVALLALAARRFFVWLDRKFRHHRLIPICSLAFCFAIAYLSEKGFGVADITGAYIVGLILSGTEDTSYIDRKSDILSYMIFAPIFFGNIGISTDFSGLSGSMLGFGLVFILAGMAGKVIGSGGAALACRYGAGDAFRVGVGMMARAEVALVCAQKGVDAGIIAGSIMPFIVLLILLTSFITPVLLQASYRGQPPLPPEQIPG